MAARRSGEERAPGADETTTKAPARDARAEALKALQAQADANREATEPEPSFEGDAVAAGGDVKVGVVFDSYQLRVDDAWRRFAHGSVLSVSKADADRGESIGGLKRL